MNTVTPPAVQTQDVTPDPVVVEAHPAPLDHSYDKYASAYRPAEHPEDHCNRVDCTVKPRIASDGRAVWNFGYHVTFTRTETTDWGDVISVAVALPEEAAGLDYRAMCVRVAIRGNDLEADSGDIYDMSLTADEADNLAAALKSRAAELRRQEKAHSEALVEEMLRDRYPNWVAAQSQEGGAA